MQNEEGAPSLIFLEGSDNRHDYKKVLLHQQRGYKNENCDL